MVRIKTFVRKLPEKIYLRKPTLELCTCKIPEVTGSSATSSHYMEYGKRRTRRCMNCGLTIVTVEINSIMFNRMLKDHRLCEGIRDDDSRTLS